MIREMRKKSEKKAKLPVDTATTSNPKITKSFISSLKSQKILNFYSI